ncbi:MAG: hypothetical protein AAB116_10000 [Candidatus Poribacteria bacterium]
MSVALKKSPKTKNTLMLLEEIKPLITRSGQVYVADHPITVDEFCDLNRLDLLFLMMQIKSLRQCNLIVPYYDQPF